MIGSLSNIIFLNPWILAGLAGLPLLWYLLRITPPAAKRIILPTARFLEGLIPDHQTPSHTPWWILLLRLMIAALVLIALAQPVYNPASELPNTKSIRLVIDNDWAAAQNWQTQIKAAEEIIAQAGRKKQEIFLISTTSTEGTFTKNGPMSEAQASALLRGLKPHPWPTQYQTLNDELKTLNNKDIHTIWLSHGLTAEGFEALAQTLRTQGPLTYIKPDEANLPLLLRKGEQKLGAIQIAVDAPVGLEENLPVSIQALAEDGRVLDQKDVTLNKDKRPLNVEFDIPEIFQADIDSFRLAGNPSASGTYIADGYTKKRSVGIAGPPDDVGTKPFIEARYYLKRALEPFSTIHTGPIEDLLDQNPSMIILPDVGAIGAETLNDLEDWVRAGGLLLRFAGPNMAGAQNFLTPVPLRANLRSTEGSLSWEDSPKLNSFSENSPFYGIDIHEDIIVRRQILPAPSEEIEENIWASLNDGTPLVTAKGLEDGLLVMIHTSASPEWSDLALSGTYVEMLQRLSHLSGRPIKQQGQIDGTLQPLWVFDAFGQKHPPSAYVQPIPAKNFGTTAPQAKHPPGLYGNSAGYTQALNLGDHIPTLKAASTLPPGTVIQYYEGSYEQDLMPYILYAALILLLLDWLIMIALTVGLRPITPFAALVLLYMIGGHTPQAHAQNDINYVNDLHLAYVKTGNTTIDGLSQKGLENLARVLKRRTSVEPGGVVALDIKRDTLVFFPLIYWPVSAQPLDISGDTILKIQHYLDHGGTILFDTRDQNIAASALRSTKNAQSLQQMIGGLNVPALEPISEDHVLGKSFYLLNSFPGHYTGGTLWVERNSLNGRDGVSSIIIGSHDWARIWATENIRRGSLSGASRQQEMAYRFGVNLMMYALTGNYKADQVHLPHILERLGQ